MAMEIAPILHSVQGQSAAEQTARHESSANVEALERRQEAAVELSREQIQQFAAELRDVVQAFNKRLSFSWNDELDQMIVKVIDPETDTVIKELPPSELQRVHLRIREAIGLLLDESV